MAIAFDTTYARLPAQFSVRCEPTRVAAPRLIVWNDRLADGLGLDRVAWTGPQGVAMLAGNHVPDGAASIACVYAGHQFGHFSPRLGDGRAILLGEVVGPDGARRDIQLKGAGPTPFSRNGDGRAALGPVLREYLVSEAMAALGVPTTRALAAVTTGQTVWRESGLPGAVLTRVAASHLRIGTFEYFAARRDTAAVRTLTDYALARHYPQAAGADNPARALLEGVVARQATLVAHWLLIGFVHGVMNTDNMSISGETIDYGPCAFIDAYDPASVFSSIDEGGRYAYANQPRIALWNLTRLAEALMPVLAEDGDAAVALAQEVLAGFGPAFEAAYQGGLRAKIGLRTEQAGDVALVRDLLVAMEQQAADYTVTFRGLGDAAAGADGAVRALFAEPAAFDGWALRWRQRLADEGGDPAARRVAMRAANPSMIPRNHLVEAALQAAVQHDDFGPFHALLDVLSTPFADRPGWEAYAAPPGAPALPYRTFCGT